MKRVTGPCRRCGTPVDRMVRSDRERLCIDCAVEKSARVQRAVAAGTHPSISKRDAHNAEFAAQVEARSGPLYDRWIEGLRRALEDHPSTQVS